MKTLNQKWPMKPHMMILSFILFFALFAIPQSKAEITPEQQQKIDKAISETTKRVPLLKDFLEKMNLGNPEVIEETSNSFKFKRARLNVPLTTILIDLRKVINDPAIHTFLNNPVIKGLENTFNTNNLVAEFTTIGSSSNPSYSFSLLGSAQNMNFEFYFGPSTASSDFILAISPQELKFSNIDKSLAVLDVLDGVDSLAEASIGLFIAKCNGSITPDMAILKNMGLKDYSFTQSLSVVSNIKVKPQSELGIFQVKNIIASAIIPLNFSAPLELKGSLKPEWELGNNIAIADVSLTLGAKLSGGNPEVSAGASFTVDTKLPSNIPWTDTSYVSWVVNANISGGPNAPRFNARLGGSGSMTGTWRSPFGLNELNLNSGDLQFGLNFDISPYPTTVTVTPDMGITGDINVGKTNKIKLTMGGNIDFSSPQSSGIYGSFTNLGLGTVLSELYLDKIGGGISAAELDSFDQIYFNQGELRFFPLGATIGSKEISAGLGLKGNAQIFGTTGNIDFAIDSAGLYGDVKISPISYKSGNEEIFALRGSMPNDSIHGKLDLSFGNIFSQLQHAFNSRPFLVIDAYLKFLGTSSQTKVILNPMKGCYFATNSKFLDIFESKLDAELPGLFSFEEMYVRGAIDQATANEINKALIDYFNNLFNGAIDYETKMQRFDQDIAQIESQIIQRRKEILDNRRPDSLNYANAKTKLDNHYAFLLTLKTKVNEAWNTHNSLPADDVFGKIAWSYKTNEAKIEVAAAEVRLLTLKGEYESKKKYLEFDKSDFDPHLIKLKIDLESKKTEKEIYKSIEGIDKQFGQLFNQSLNYFLSVNKDLSKVIHLNSIEFDGKLAVLSSGSMGARVNLNYLGNPVNLETNFSISNNFDEVILPMIKDLLAGNYNPGNVPTFESEIGTKYNYSKNIQEVRNIQVFDFADYNPTINTNNPIGVPGNTSAFNSFAHTFNGVSASEDLPGAWGNGWKEMTVEAWIKNDGSTNDFQTILSGNQGLIHFQMNKNSAGNNVLYLTNGMAILLPALSDAPTDWRHVAIVFKSGYSALYQNGELIGSPNYLSFGDGQITPATHIRIGDNKVHGRKFKGKMANIAIWNKAKTQAEIKAGMANFQDAPGLVAPFYTNPNNMTQALNQRSTLFSNQSNTLIPCNFCNNLNEVTIEAWIKNTSATNDIQAIVSASGPQFVHLQMSNDNNVSNAVYMEDGRSMMLPVIPKVSAGWHHVAMSIKSGDSRVYLDGQQIGATNTTTFASIAPASDFYIGKGWAGQRAFTGEMANVKIWKKALTKSQLNNEMNDLDSGNSPDMVYHSPTLSPIKITNSSNCLPIPEAATIGLESMTIEAWINNQTGGEDIQAIVSSSTGDFVHLQTSNNPAVQNMVYTDNGEVALPVIPKLTSGWHHVAIVVESGNSRIYVDGVMTGSNNTKTFSNILASQSASIGKGWAGGRVFNGSIADVRIWKNRALTQAQIESYRHTPPPASAQGLVYHSN